MPTAQQGTPDQAGIDPPFDALTGVFGTSAADGATVVQASAPQSSRSRTSTGRDADERPAAPEIPSEPAPAVDRYETRDREEPRSEEQRQSRDRGDGHRDRDRGDSGRDRGRNDQQDRNRDRSRSQGG